MIDPLRKLSKLRCVGGLSIPYVGLEGPNYLTLVIYVDRLDPAGRSHPERTLFEFRAAEIFDGLTGASCRENASSYLRSGASIWRTEMEQIALEFADPEMEIIPPACDDDEADVVVCLCCQRLCSQSRMDDDGCGICEECIAS